MSEPQDDKIVWAHNAPERSSIKSFSTKELVDELCKRDGVREHIVPPHESREYYIGGAARILVVIG